MSISVDTLFFQNKIIVQASINWHISETCIFNAELIYYCLGCSSSTNINGYPWDFFIPCFRWGLFSLFGIFKKLKKTHISGGISVDIWPVDLIWIYLGDISLHGWLISWLNTLQILKRKHSRSTTVKITFIM